MTITQKLQALRGRLKTIYGAVGALRLLAELFGFLIVLYFLDRWLDIPRPVRVVLLVLAVLVFADRVRRLLVYPLRRRIAVKDMALAVERRHRSLDGQLASAVELARQAENPPPDVSPGLLKLWLSQLEGIGEKVQYEAVFHHRRLKQLGMVAAGLLLVIVVFAVQQQQETGVFARRLFGMDVEWPRRTHLSLQIQGESPHYRVERDASGRPVEVLVAKSASLPVEVRVTGSVPREVFLRIDQDNRFRSGEEVRMMPREGEDGVFTFRFRNVQRAMTIRPKGGDDSGDGREVEVIVSTPPSVERLVATMTPPAYTGLPTIREERQGFRVPVGTVIALEIETVGAVVEGTVTQNNDPATEMALSADPENPKLLLHSFEVAESGTFNLHLTAQNGFRNIVPLDYVVTAIPDRRPIVEIMLPGSSSIEVTDRAVVPFRLLASDDYGLTQVAIRVGRFGMENHREMELTANDGGPLRLQGGTKNPLQIPLDLLTFQLPREGRPDSVRQGDTLLYTFFAADNKTGSAGAPEPNTFQTQPRSIELVSEGEKSRKLADRQMRIKHAVNSLKITQEEKRDGLAALLEAEGPGQIDWARELSALEVDQTRVLRRAEQVSRDFGEVLDEYILNRMDASPTAERVVLFRLDQIAEDTSTTRFDLSAYRSLIAAQQEGQFGQLDVLANLIDMVELAMTASEAKATEALEALQLARITSEEEQRPGLFDETLARQDEFIELYRQLLKKMEEWEDFQEILDLWRGLVDDQTDINRRYRELGEQR